jgi:phage gp45-like
MIQDFPYLVEGVVMDTADPQEMGRIKVWCPAIDGNDVDLDTIPWATYVSPLAGQAHNYPAGGRGAQSVGPVSYGFFAVPKIGAQVVIGFLYGDYNQRIYVGSFFRDHGNRSLPAGRNVENGAPQSDSYETIEPTASNLAAQFQNNLSSSIARTRGAYERQVAQAADEKTTAEGYDVRVIDAGEDKAGRLDPQTYCITTPGRHAIIMQDHPAYARLRLKTAEGHQIIFDDANERIYVSTSRGRTWLELDVDGHVNLYGAESISMSAGADFNLQAGGNVNISAGGNVNIGATKSMRLTGCDNLSLAGNGSVNIESGGKLDILASGGITQTGSTIHLNGPTASGATCPDKPSITPSHEPWTRPASAITRGKNWKE